MNIEINKSVYPVIFKAIVGSHAYNLNDQHSDIDYVGFFHVPSADYVNLYPDPPEQTASHSKTEDVTYYSLRRALLLASLGNPNFTELLWSPERCVLHRLPVMDVISRHRHIFLTQKLRYSYGGYAFSQIKKARSQNKWISNPKSEHRPQKLDFCQMVSESENGQPARTTPVNVDLSEFHISRVEGGHNLYRLYRYGKEAKGVFRGENLVCESIPLEDEKEKFFGLMIYNEDAYNKELKDWKHYHEWKKNRNEERWAPKDGLETDCNYKNISHCIRLMYSAINIFENGEPLVWLEGEKRQRVLDIKHGKCHYEDVIKEAEEMEAQLDIVFAANKHKFPHGCNMAKVNDLYLECIEHLESSNEQS
jgi:hypothetical protein